MFSVQSASEYSASSRTFCVATRLQILDAARAIVEVWRPLKVSRAHFRATLDQHQSDARVYLSTIRATITPIATSATAPTINTAGFIAIERLYHG